MSDICNAINKLEDLMHLTAASEDQISLAEKELNLRFAEEYKEYVKSFGVISAYGIELTGICKSPRLSVVNVTKRERKNSNLPDDLYVIENVGIEGLLLLQNEAGEIYQLDENKNLQKRYDSLSQYIEEHLK